MIDRTSQDWARHEEGAEPLAALLEDLLQSWDLSAPGDRSGEAGQQPAGTAPSASGPGVEELFAALSQRLAAPDAVNPGSATETPEAAQPPDVTAASAKPADTFDDSFVSSEAEPPAGFLWLSELPNVPEGDAAGPAPAVEPIASPAPSPAADWAARVEVARSELAPAADAVEEVPAQARTEAVVESVPETAARVSLPEAAAEPDLTSSSTSPEAGEAVSLAAATVAVGPKFEIGSFEGESAEAASQAPEWQQPAAKPAKRTNLASDSGEVKVPISEYPPNDRYLLFRMSGNLFALSLPGVAEAERLPALTPVPGMPGFLRGIFSHRGEIVPLVNLPELLGLEQEDQHLSSGKIMIVRSPQGPLALAAESLEGLSGIYPHEIDHLAELGGTLRPAVKGTAQLGNRTVCVLDLEKVFALEKLKDLVGADSAIPETV